MRRVLLIDTETSGLDPEKDFLLEVAAGLWSVEHQTLLRATTWLVRAEANAAFQVNGIPVEILADQPPRKTVIERVSSWFTSSEADAIVSHGDFDRRVLWELDGHPWIDTCDDIELPGSELKPTWPRGANSKGLTALALAHGITGFSGAHRALDDVLTLARLLERAGELGANVHALLSRGLRPKSVFEVSDKRFDEKRNELAKQNGFRWDAPTKSWRRRMAVEDAIRMPFAVSEAQ